MQECPETPESHAQFVPERGAHFHRIFQLAKEAKYREMRDLERRTNAARLPMSHDLDHNDFTKDNDMSKTQLN